MNYLVPDKGKASKHWGCVFFILFYIFRKLRRSISQFSRLSSPDELFKSNSQTGEACSIRWMRMGAAAAFDSLCWEKCHEVVPGRVRMCFCCCHCCCCCCCCCSCLGCFCCCWLKLLLLLLLTVVMATQLLPLPLLLVVFSNIHQ